MSCAICNWSGVNSTHLNGVFLNLRIPNQLTALIEPRTSWGFRVNSFHTSGSNNVGSLAFSIQQPASFLRLGRLRMLESSAGPMRSAPTVVVCRMRFGQIDSVRRSARAASHVRAAAPSTPVRHSRRFVAKRDGRDIELPIGDVAVECRCRDSAQCGIVGIAHGRLRSA